MNSSIADQRSLILRHWPWRLLLLLLLLPLAFAAVNLAQLSKGTALLKLSDDGEYVLTGSYRQQRKVVDCRVLSLMTGQTASFRTSAIDLRGFGDRYVLWFERDTTDWVTAKQLDLATFQQSELGRFDGKGLPDQFSSLQSGVFAAANEQNELVVIDLLDSSRTTLPLPPIQSSTFHSWLPTSSGSPARLILMELSTRATKGKERMLLFSHAQGELTKLSEWTGVSYPRVASDSVLSMVNTSLMEVRQLSDGVLVETQALDKILNVAPGIGIHLGEPKSGLVPVYIGPGRNIIYDYVRQQIVLERSMSMGRCLDLGQDAAIFSDQRSVEVVRLSDQQTLQRFDFQQYVMEAKFVEDGKQLQVLLGDESVQRYNLATGELLRTWRSRAWVVPTIVAMLVGFAAWSCLWVWLGLRSGWHPLVDTIVLHGLVATGLMLPVLWYENLLTGGAFEFVDAESLAACWLLLVSLWCVFGRARWSLRLLGPILGMAAALGWNFFVFRGQGEIIAVSAVGVVGVASLFSILLGLARRWGFRWINEQQLNYSQPVTQTSLQIPLRDSFWMMSTIAIFVAVARFVPLKQFDFRSMSVLLTFVAGFSIAALGGAWSALGPRSWLTRIGCMLILIVGVGAVQPGLFQVGLTWNDWLGGLRAFSPLAISSFGSLLIFRVRGWRLIGPRLARKK